MPVRRKNSGLLKILLATGIAAFLGYLSFPYITQAPRVVIENAFSAEININQPIPITFSQVMNGKSTENSIRISPDVPFAYEWHGKALFLKLEAPQEDGTIISVHVDKDIKNLIGRKMSKDTNVEFILKKPPRVSHVYPENILKADEPIYVTFSEEMIDQKNPLMQKTPTIEPLVRGLWEWITPSTMKFSPAENYQQSIKYNLIIPKGIKNIRGIPTQEDAIHTFETEKIEVVRMDEWHGIITKPLSITFSQPIETSRIKNCIKIAEGNHVLEDIKIEQLIKDKDEYTVEIMPINGWEYGRSYKITVKPGAPHDHEEKKEMVFTTNRTPNVLKATDEKDATMNTQENDTNDKSETSPQNKNETSINFDLPHSFEISENAEQKSIGIITKNISEIIVEACEISEKTLAIITAHELLDQIPFAKICKEYGSEKREIPPSQQEEITEIKISDLIKKESKKTLYLLRATDVKTGKNTTSAIIPSKLKIFAKKSPEDALVWIQNQNSQDIQVRGYNDNGELLFAENTNSNGILYQQNLKQPLSILFAETENQLGFLNTEWQQSIHPSEYGQQIILQESSLDIFTTTDKDTYSQNETVYIAGMVREKEGSSIKVPANRSIHVAIRDAENFEIYRKQVNTQDGFFRSEAKLFEDTPEGTYTLMVCAGFLGQYCEGNESYSFFHVGENKIAEKIKDDNNSPKENENPLSIQFDKEKYQIGDEARVRFYYDKESVALVTVERQGVHNFHILETKPGFNATTLPITENLIPNAFVSIVIPRESTYDIGYKEFEIEKNAKRIKVNTSVNKKNNTENEYIVNIKTRNYQNEPLSTRIIIALSEKENDAPKTNIENQILDYFFSRTGLGVLNTSNMTRGSNYNFAEDEYAQNASGSSLAKNTGETLVWSSELQTDENGEMEHVIQIPNGKMAILHTLAISNKTEIGYVETSVDTRDILTVGNSIPDRVYSGDQFFITPLITNMKSKEKITINIETSSLRIIGQNEISVQIKPGEEKKISFHIEVPAVSRKASEEIVITAKTENYSEQKKIKISLLPADQLNKLNIVGNLNGQSVKEIIPSLEQGKNQKIDIYVGTSELTFIMSNIEELLSKQISTTEEMMSRIWPLAIIIKNSGMESFQNLSLPQLRDSNQEEITIKDIIENTLDGIVKSQNRDGGWTYYWNIEKNTESDVATSAYIFAGLGAIKKSGFKVNNTAYQKAYSFVTKNLYALENDQKDMAAFIVAMLTETDRYEVGLMQKLLKEKNMLSTGGKLYLATALHNAELKEEAKKILDELLEETHVSENSARLYAKNSESPALMMSDVKRTSLLIMLMDNIYPESTITNNAIRWVATKANNTLREQAHTIRAIVSTMKNQNNIELYTEIIFNNNQKNSIKKNIDSNIINEKISFSKHLKQKPHLNEITIISKNPHQLFYCITSFFSNSAIQSKASSKELGIARAYSKLTEFYEKENTQIMEVGNKITGSLTIIVPGETNFVTIKEPLPGGLKFLTTTAESKHLKIANISDNTLTLVAEKLEPGIYVFEYIAEATTSGTFFHAPATILEQYGTKKEGSTLPSWITIKNL